MTALRTLNPYWPDNYDGQKVSADFQERWLSMKHVGVATPYARVRIRRGFMNHTYHSHWPGDNAPGTVAGRNPKQFGRILGLPQFPYWYPDWTPTTDWVDLPGVAEVDINQSVSFAGGDGGDGSGGAGGSNGIAIATLQVDNVAWAEVAGEFGSYHVKQRGWLWPWRGYVPTGRPGGGVEKNQWYDTTPNAQILVEQGYGEDTAVKTFTGLIDTIGPGNMRPDRITITSRDFGAGLVDVNPFGWNKDIRIKDPFYFVPPDYPNLKGLGKKGTHNWVICHDATDIVRSALRWVGFKEWEIEDAGVQLKTAYLVDRSGTWMDVVNEVASQLGYVFFIAEPTDDDLSIGVPVFRKQQVLQPRQPQPFYLDSHSLTSVQPSHDNTNERDIIRVRGRLTTRKAGGRPIIGGDMNEDGQIAFTFQYWPPWLKNMSGIIKQLTYYNIGSNGVLGFSSKQECMVACLLIAVQIAMTRDTATIDCPGSPAAGLDSMAYVNDAKASGVCSRLYITGRRSTMTLGGDGTTTASAGSTGQDSNQLLWSTELTGPLVDNPEWDQIVKDYHTAVSGGVVQTHGGLFGEQ